MTFRTAPFLPYNGSGIKGVDEAGNVALSTRNASSGDTYTVIVHAIKEYHRPADVSGLASYNVAVAAGTNSYITGNVFYVMRPLAHILHLKQIAVIDLSKVTLPIMVIH